jgi:predicted enzyme related to lactoylglutathione lyase
MTNFSLSSVDEAPEAVAKFLLVFEVDDLAAYRLKIESAGGEITARRDMRRHGILLASKDIGGNSLQLFQKATAPAQR